MLPRPCELLLESLMLMALLLARPTIELTMLPLVALPWGPLAPCCCCSCCCSRCSRLRANTDALGPAPAAAPSPPAPGGGAVASWCAFHIASDASILSTNTPRSGAMATSDWKSGLTT